MTIAGGGCSHWLTINPIELAVGLTQNSALEITRNGARTIGDNALVALDLRNAALDLGTNDGFVIANGLLDVFAPGETGEARQRRCESSAHARTHARLAHHDAHTHTDSNTHGDADAPPADRDADAHPDTHCTPTETPEPTATPDPATTATSEGLPLVPMAIGAGLIFFIVVLLAGRRRP